MQVIGTKHVLLVAPEDRYVDIVSHFAVLSLTKRFRFSQYMHAIPDLRHKSYIDPWKPEEFSGYSKAKLYEVLYLDYSGFIWPVTHSLANA
jgi:hypothetical protein